jgi:hypothetical protein
MMSTRAVGRIVTSPVRIPTSIVGSSRKSRYFWLLSALIGDV